MPLEMPNVLAERNALARSGRCTRPLSGQRRWPADGLGITASGNMPGRALFVASLVVHEVGDALNAVNSRERGTCFIGFQGL